MGRLADGDVSFKLADLTPCWLRDNYLPGLVFIDDHGRPFGDSWYEHHLKTATARIEKACDIAIVEQERRGETHDYHVDEFYAYGHLVLNKAPVRRVLRLSAMHTLGHSIVTYPDEWIRLDAQHGIVNLVAARGALGQGVVMQTGDFMPFFTPGVSMLPHLWHVDYIAGMDPEDFPIEVADAIAKLAILNIAQIASDFIRPLGVNNESRSGDGWSQSTGYASSAFSARVDAYMIDLWGKDGPQASGPPAQGLLRVIHDHYRGVLLTAV